MSDATQSCMAMMQGAIALAWLDSKLTEEEKQQLHTCIAHNVHLSDTQKAQLHNNIDHQMHLKDIWPRVTEKRDRAHLINIAMLIFWKDGHYCDKERAAFEFMNECHGKTLDMETMRNEIAMMAKQAREKIEEEEEAYYKDLSPAARVVAYIDEFIFG